MNVLITGVGGFIASHIARKFIKEGYHVIGVDDFSGGKKENVPNGVEMIEGDLANQETINKIPKNCSYILHLAGQSSGEMSFDDPILDLRKNSISTLNLIKFARDNRVKKILFASSVSIYGSAGERGLNEHDMCGPSSCYGVSKLAGEGYLRIYSKDIPYVNMRMFNVYGPGQDLDNLRQGMVSIYLAQAIRVGNIHIKGSIDRFRDYIFIDDVVEAWYRATTRDDIFNISINIGTGIRTSVKQLLNIIKSELPDIKWYVEGATLGDQFGHYSNNNILIEKLGISEFTSLHIGIRKFIAWANNH